MLLILVMMVAIVTAHGAVIEVTGGATPSDATVRFSDSSGTQLVTLSASSSATVTSSADVTTGTGTSVNDLGTRLAAAEATITALLSAIGVSIVRARQETTGSTCGCQGYATVGMGSPVGQTFTSDLRTGSATAQDAAAVLDGSTTTVTSTAGEAMIAVEVRRSIHRILSACPQHTLHRLCSQSNGSVDTLRSSTFSVRSLGR